MLETLAQTLERSYRLVRDRRMKLVLRIQALAARSAREWLDSQGFLEMLPPIIGPVTDPGIRGAKQATVDFYGREYKVMSSAILYKQMLVSGIPKIYFFSPNIRLEPLDSAYTGRHLVEFVQLDLEMAEASYHDAMHTAENLLSHIISSVAENGYRELEELGRELRPFKPPYKRFTHAEVVEMLWKMGEKANPNTEIPWPLEEKLSRAIGEPFFITDYPKGARGFYDREDPARPGILRDFDLLYPEGFGEAASGAEREYEYSKILARLRETGENPAKYGWYQEMLRDGVPPSAGFGIGVERLTRYLCGLTAVWEARPYPKLAGIYSP